MLPVIQISKYTFIEIIRSKVLYAILAFAVILIAVSSAFANVTIGDPLKMIKDFGLFSISVFGIVFVSVSGSTLLSKELQRKTIYNILSRPISRQSYLVGKFLGLWGASSLLSLAMIGALYAYTILLGDTPQINLLIAGSYMLLDLCIACALLSLLSAIFVTPFLSGLIAFCFCLAGRFVSHLDYFVSDNAGLWAKVLAGLLPRFDLTNIINSTAYGTIPGGGHFMFALLYTIAYSAAVLILATAAFRNREFN
jgi:ABC-type transport system involved in multi-copper enzyme maturation permease subunit